MAYAGAGSFVTVGLPVQQYRHGSSYSNLYAQELNASLEYSNNISATVGASTSLRKLLQVVAVGPSVTSTSGGLARWTGDSTPSPYATAAFTKPVDKRAILSSSVDRWGGLVLGLSVAVVLLYIIVYLTVKHRKASRLKMHPKFGGALRLAAARGDIKTMHALAEGSGRFHVDADHGGWTPLHTAAVEGKAVCQVLLAYGGSLEAENYAGHTAVELAARGSHRRLADYLKRVKEGRAARPTPSSLPTAVHRQVLRAGAEYMADIRAAISSSSISGAADRTNSTPGEGRSKQDYESQESDEIQEESLPPAKPRRAIARKLAAAAAKRAWEGAGSSGTLLTPGLWAFRALAVLAQAAMAGYIVWRALRTLNPGWSYFFSIPYWLCEFAGFVLSNAFVISLWNQIDRPRRRIADMLAPSQLPAVDVYIATYSEPVKVLEPTVVAALNMNYPGSKLSVHILDDGRRPEVAAMARRLRFQARYMGREAQLLYVGREKVKGVRHHDKAGNINSALLKESPGKGTFVLILDCDMIVHPDFIQNTVGHFYHKPKGEHGPWVLKEKAAFIQTPQDFWNIDASDPLVHSARFFYGPMLQGRDGIGACPCCGTGVVFRRDVLVSLGGQSYGSITEDYNTAMNLLGAGFATMFLNERLVFGMAPTDIEAAFKQRLRWAMGALQILSKNNPLAVPGLSTIQSLLFFEALAHHWLAVSTVLLALLPIPYLFTGYSPVVAPAMWEFTLVFGIFYSLNRLMLWCAHRNVEGAGQEMWRGSQMWVWMAPNHIKAIWKVVVVDSWIFRKLFGSEIKFAVTKKDLDGDGQEFWEAMSTALTYTWPYLLWAVGFFCGVVYFLVGCAMRFYTGWDIVVSCVSIMWGMLVLLSIWPPLATLLPREETEEGWRIKWDAILPLPNREERMAHRLAVEHRTVEMQRQHNAASGSAVRPVLTVGDAVGDSLAGGPVLKAFVPVVPAAQLNGGVTNATGPVWTLSTSDGCSPAVLPGSPSHANKTASGDGGTSAPPPLTAAMTYPTTASCSFLPVTGVAALDQRLRQRKTTSIPETAVLTINNYHHAVDLTRMTTGSGRVSTSVGQLYYSPAANAARASGSNAIGRIALPGRTVAVVEAASLLTQVVLPEPSDITDPHAHRLLGVDSAGMMVPPLTNNPGSAFERHLSAAAEARRSIEPTTLLHESGQESSGSNQESSSLGFSYSYASTNSNSNPSSPPKHHNQHSSRAADRTTQHVSEDAASNYYSGCGSSKASSPSQKLQHRKGWTPKMLESGAGNSTMSGSGTTAAAKAATAAAQFHTKALTIRTHRVPSTQEDGPASGKCAVAGLEDIGEQSPSGGEAHSALAAQQAPLYLRMMAAAVQSLLVESHQAPHSNLPAGSGSRHHHVSDGTSEFATAVPGSKGQVLRYKSSSPTEAVGAVVPAAGISGIPVLFSAEYSVGQYIECAVIPTETENVYQHTIAAVPNFNNRLVPASNWMMLVINFVLLGTLVIASFYEVYGPR
eukprot:gene10775-10931_t